ncbi:MAG TPA: PP2C family serine/threonine-protein phosphatase [Allosphingosinicella sp.]
MVRWMPFFRRDPPAKPGGEESEGKSGASRLAGSRDPTEGRDGKGARQRKIARGDKPPQPVVGEVEPPEASEVQPPVMSEAEPEPPRIEPEQEDQAEEVTRLTFGPLPPVARPFLIQSASLTHEGKVRTRNEDSFCVRDKDGLWAVADGMGGHEGGEWASGRIVDELGLIAMDQGFEAACDAAAAAVGAANEAILAEARERGKQMGSTVVLLIVDGTRYAILWVGDSRAYLLRDSALTQLSRDHSQVQEMVDRGLMTAEQAVGHPMGHILSRAVGVREEVVVDKVVGEVRPGDVFLLCSDGLYGYVDESDIDGLLSREAPDRALKQLVDMTLENGAPDNVTGITIWASEPTLLSFADSKA